MFAKDTNQCLNVGCHRPRAKNSNDIFCSSRCRTGWKNEFAKLEKRIKMASLGERHRSEDSASDTDGTKVLRAASVSDSDSDWSAI